ncbi:MAG: hypothetical protein WA584_20010 [Pyrinomonadaceae bacterium]
MENEKAQKLAEKIALLLQENGKGSDDAALLRASLEKINQRLDKIESQLTIQNPNSKLQTPNLNHPSQEKYNIAEIIADEIFAGIEKEKACPYEPTGKPCDHCAMCNSRGF